MAAHRRVRPMTAMSTIATAYHLRAYDERRVVPGGTRASAAIAASGIQRADASCPLAGIGLEALRDGFRARHDDYSAIMAEALADRLAEAFAEHLHERARRAWGYGRDEHLTKEDLLAEKYRGIRPAFGYPACPDHSEKRKLFDLLGAEDVGISLTESGAMIPPASVSGIYLGHPEARYFNVGRLGRDQIEDYARRKGMAVAEVERWLGQNLGYEPAPT